MLKLTLLLPSDDIIGAKEAIAQTLEPLGDVKVIKVEEIKDVEQTTF